MSCELWADRLDSYADGETPAADLAGLEEHLRMCSACAAAAMGRMQMKRATRAAAAMRFTPPPELRRRIEKAIAQRRSRLGLWMSPAPALAWVLAVAVAVSSVVLVRHAERERALSQLLDMHVAALASPNRVDVVSSDRHTVKPWFQGKLPFTFTLPELAGSLYQLDGGRLVYFRGQPGAQLIYELRRHEFSVFIVQDRGMAAGGVSDEKKNGFSAESWSAGGLRYVVMSDAGAGEVRGLGELLRGAQ